jgi:hypothetical protein
MPFKPSDWDSYTSHTEHLAVARWGRIWRVVDKETGSEIGMPFKTRTEAESYARYRESTTYSPEPAR